MTTFYLAWPQVAWIGLTLVALAGISSAHGKPLVGNFNGWRALLRIAVVFVLLYSGGFFSPAHAQVPAGAARYRFELIRAAHSQWGLNAPVAVLAAQVHQESSWNPQAISRVGAAGLGQFMPGTTSWWCGRTGTGAADCLPHNPTWALRALVGYDKYLYDLTPAHYSARDRMWVALRGYNGGLGHWRAEAARTGIAFPTREQVDAACGRAKRSGVHCPENLGYPLRIMTVLQPRYAAWGPGV